MLQRSFTNSRLAWHIQASTTGDTGGIAVATWLMASYWGSKCSNGLQLFIIMLFMATSKESCPPTPKQV